MVEVLPFNGGVMRLEWEKAEREVLVRGVTHLQWFYQDGATGQWVQDWPSSKPYFPARIRIELGDALGRWPSLVVALPRAR